LGWGGEYDWRLRPAVAQVVDDDLHRGRGRDREQRAEQPQQRRPTSTARIVTIGLTCTARR
jgi:hypothetical protein